MSLIVQKYGGTSVGSLDRIRGVAERVAATYREGHQVIVVVSAMAGQTDKLLSMGWELSNGPAEREMDVLRVMATGGANKEIAAALTLSESTVKTHIANIFHKLEVNDRTGAVTEALRRKIISI